MDSGDVMDHSCNGPVLFCILIEGVDSIIQNVLCHGARYPSVKVEWKTCDITVTSYTGERQLLSSHICHWRHHQMMRLLKSIIDVNDALQ